MNRASTEISALDSYAAQRPRRSDPPRQATFCSIRTDDVATLMRDRTFTVGNRLYRNEGNRLFTDATDLYGVREGDWGMGCSLSRLRQ